MAGEEPAAQEPWDYDRFVAAYNALAEERGGWHYEADVAPEVLAARYANSPATYPTIAAFAEGLFIWEQRVNL
jgi:hypothetical protein